MIFFVKKFLKLVKSRFHRYVVRPLNQRHRYDFPSEHNSFHMVVSARRTRSLLMVDSADGIFWENVRTILSGQTGQWDDNVSRGCLLSHNGKRYLWYTGQIDGIACIGLAINSDGEDFCRVGNAPVLKADLHFEGVSVMNPCVLWDETESLFKMWYSAGDTYEPDVICYAESADGILWKKKKAPILSKCLDHAWEWYKVGGCSVLKNTDGTYEIYYIGYQNLDVARICFAHSKNGKTWTRDDENLVLSPSAKSWDSDAVYKPSVVKVRGKYYLWYNGRRNREEYIGLAVKDE